MALDNVAQPADCLRPLGDLSRITDLASRDRPPLLRLGHALQLISGHTHIRSHSDSFPACPRANCVRLCPRRPIICVIARVAEPCLILITNSSIQLHSTDDVFPGEGKCRGDTGAKAGRFRTACGVARRRHRGGLHAVSNSAKARYFGTSPILWGGGGRGEFQQYAYAVFICP